MIGLGWFLYSSCVHVHLLSVSLLFFIWMSVTMGALKDSRLKGWGCCCYSVVSDSLWPYELQHSRFPCPSLSPWVCWNSCPLSQWCHPTISSSVVPFSSCLQSFPASGSFLVSQFFSSGGQSIGASAFLSKKYFPSLAVSPPYITW